MDCDAQRLKIVFRIVDMFDYLTNRSRSWPLRRAIKSVITVASGKGMTIGSVITMSINTSTHSLVRVFFSASAAYG